MKVKKEKLHVLLEMIDCGDYCNDAYFNWFGKSCKDISVIQNNGIVECNEKCPFFNVENMMKWLKEGE